MDETDQLLRQMTDADMDVRWKAMLSIDEIDDPRVIGSLLQLLNDPIPEVRALAAQQLRQKRAARGMLHEHRVPALLNLLTDESAEVRAAACYALGGDYCREALEPLISSLNDPAEDVRAAAAEALCHYPSRRAVKALLSARNDHNDQVRYAVAEALAFFDVPEVVQPLLEMADDDLDAVVRCKAIEGLQYVVHRHAPTLLEMVYPEHEPVNQLLNMLKEKNDQVVMEVIHTLGTIGDERAVTPLVALLCDWSKDFARRLWAASALGRFKDPRVAPILIAALSDPHPGLRPAAARALGRLGDARALPALEGAAQSAETNELAEAAAKAAEQIRYELSWEKFDRVAEFLACGSYEERCRALSVLAQADDLRARELIVRTLSTALEETDTLLFAAAAKIAARLGEVQALPLLERGIEFWRERDCAGIVAEAERAVACIQRLLQGEELEPYQAWLADDEMAVVLDDEEDEEAEV